MFKLEIFFLNFEVLKTKRTEIQLLTYIGLHCHLSKPKRYKVSIGKRYGTNDKRGN